MGLYQEMQIRDERSKVRDLVRYLKMQQEVFQEQLERLNRNIERTSGVEQAAYIGMRGMVEMVLESHERKLSEYQEVQA
jgi:hypothetical protein